MCVAGARELRKGRGKVAASWAVASETHLEALGQSWCHPGPQTNGQEREVSSRTRLGRCRAEHVPGEMRPLHITGQVNPGAGNEMIKGMRDCVFQSKDAEHKN